ncbi:hypothetical protein [Pseudarthrobacter sulfonivorans]|nr:hypothetical protein [Pseudarthrobacter sulfonivorans]MDR6415267.1 hypothetical protein [Pseudarthrobacter sulfonivorans]
MNASEKVLTFTRVITVKEEKLFSARLYLCSPPSFLAVVTAPSRR